jgi:LuxR family maltose regulon positive regulatory protein
MQYQRGLLKEAERALNDSYEMGRQVRGQEWIGANGATYLAELLFVRGRLGEAQHMAQKAADLAGESPGAAVFARSTQAFILYYRNDLEGAARSARLSVEFSKRGGSVAIWINTCWWLVETRLAQGDLAGATAEMESMDQVARLPGIPRQNRAYHAAWHVLFAIRQRDLASTVEWGNRLQEYADALNFNVSTVPARLLIARGEKEAAAKQLQALHERAVGADAQGLVIGIRIYQALAAPSPDEALIFLTEALTLGRPEGWIRRFADEGRLLSPLLRRALSQGITPEYTAELLRIIEVEELQRTIGKAEPEFSSATASLLTKRETEVLRLVAEGLSNDQIANKLSISLSTAKTHVHHLFDKLGAKDRLHTIARAKELKLI